LLSRRIPTSQWLAATALAGLILLVVVLGLTRHGEPPPDPNGLPTVIEVRGDVSHPGIFLLASPVTIISALAAAGGCGAGSTHALIEAETGQPLHSGQLLRVACSETDGVKLELAEMEAAARLTLGQKLDVNRASGEELCLVPGMHPASAQAIVTRRATRPWRELRELEELPGIGPKTVEKWQDYLEVGKAAASPN
jgi:DNA uptake protein ComE-like DNA-binding protein